MRDKLIEPFIEAFNQSADMIFNGWFENPKIEYITRFEKDAGVHVLLGLAGDIAGTVFLSAERDNALRLASAMEGKTFREFEDIAVSALQELLNIVAGGAITSFYEMDMEVDITPPTFVEGKEIDIRLFYPIISAELCWENIKVYLNLAVNENGDS